jgi:hypothetical protein
MFECVFTYLPKIWQKSGILASRSESMNRPFLERVVERQGFFGHPYKCPMLGSPPYPEKLFSHKAKIVLDRGVKGVKVKTLVRFTQ